jgi:hypothetical protein
VFSAARRETDPQTVRSIGSHFSRTTLAGIIDSLSAAAPEDRFATQVLETIAKKSPTSLAVTFQSISRGLRLSMDDCMRMEYRILRRMLLGHDFFEGIRCTVIDKGDQPAWTPADLAGVTQADVDAYFEPLGESELTL